MKPEVSQEQVEMQLLLPFLKEMLGEGREIKMTVTGNSMFPLLRDRRDSVLLAVKEKPKKYDIALFVRKNGEAVLHRIIKLREGAYIMLGDNQLEEEGPILPGQIVAVVKGFYRDDYYVSCSKWWYQVYSFLWSNAGRMRMWLRPVVIRCGRLIKRVERME